MVKLGRVILEIGLKRKKGEGVPYPHKERRRGAHLPFFGHEHVGG